VTRLRASMSDEAPPKSSRTPLKSLSEALKERRTPEQFSRIFGDESKSDSENSR
jgi:hypothetical protein